MANYDVDELESEIKLLAERCSPELARKIAVEICLAGKEIANQPICDELVSHSIQVINGNNPVIDEIRSRSLGVYDSLYGGDGEPTPQVLAFSAFGEIAFTTDGYTALENSGVFVAKAKAMLAADNGNDDEYDEQFDAAYIQERSRQLELIKRAIGKNESNDELSD